MAEMWMTAIASLTVDPQLPHRCRPILASLSNIRRDLRDQRTSTASRFTEQIAIETIAETNPSIHYDASHKNQPCPLFILRHL